MAINYIRIMETKTKAVGEHGRDQFGYGRKITTQTVARPIGSHRFYRVYATCFSNAASYWIIKDKQVRHLS
jgi:hypothetical protein